MILPSHRTAKELQLNIGDEFKVIDDSGHAQILKGDIVVFSTDDGSYCPYFDNKRTGSRTCILLKRLEKIMEYEVGQILITPSDDERTIVEVTKNLVFFADGDDEFGDNYGQVGFAATPKWLEEKGWKVKNDDTVEMTISEVAEKLGVDADKLRIKKED